ncbi:MAG TPA: Rrf2 family transcriptional regulator, partial [Eubacteriaceae bacterium]|nr:Rrf2 family transcriptional regulator [Eubacteriaceae bacterium]
SRSPKQITAYHVLSSVENSLFEKNEQTTKEKSPEIDMALNLVVFQPLDETIQVKLQSITLYDLVTEAEKQKKDQGLMFFI